MEDYLKSKNENGVRHEEDVSFGPMIAIIIIVALIIIGGLYVLKKTSPPKYPVKEGAVKDSVIYDLSRQNSSDEIRDIKKDLSATSIEALDRGLTPLSGAR